MKYFKGWNWFEYSFLVVAVVVPVTVGVIAESGVLEIVTSGIALVAGLLIAKAKVGGYFVNLVALVLYSIVAYQAGLYGEVGFMYVVTLPICIYGIVNWLRNKRVDEAKGEVIKIGHAGLVEIGLLVLSQVVMGFGYYFLLQAFNAEHLIIQTVTLMVSVCAAYLLARRSPLGIVGYIGYDTMQIVLWTLVVVGGSTGAMVMLAMPICFLINDAYGTFNWLRLRKNQNKNL